MALSTEEDAQGRVAFREITHFEQLRKLVWFWTIYLLIAFGRIIDGIDSHRGSHILGLTLTIAYFVLIAYGAWTYVRLKKRYPANLKFISSLREREGGTLGFEDEILHRPALMHFWTRRLEKRALLWRVDRFLSGDRQSG